jgi:hypothetical protein
MITTATIIIASISAYLHLYYKESIPRIQPKTKNSLLSIASDQKRTCTFGAKNKAWTKNRTKNKRLFVLKIA